MFSEEEIEELRKVSLWDIIVNSTKIHPNSIQQNVFFWNEGDPCPQPMQLNTSLLEPCKHLSGYDYFEVIILKTQQKNFNNYFSEQGNELVYIYACVFLGFVPILCAGAAYGVVKLQNKRRRRLKIKQEELRNTAEGKLPVDTMMVQEWLHANHKRLVKIKFGPEAAIHIIGRKGEKLRSVSFRNIDNITLEESLDVTSKKKPLVLIRVPRDHDLVLELDSLGLRKKFITKFEMFLASNKKNLICTQVICN